MGRSQLSILGGIQLFSEKTKSCIFSLEMPLQHAVLSPSQA